MRAMFLVAGISMLCHAAAGTLRVETDATKPNVLILFADVSTSCIHSSILFPHLLLQMIHQLDVVQRATSSPQIRYHVSNLVYLYT